MKFGAILVGWLLITSCNSSSQSSNIADIDNIHPYTLPNTEVHYLTSETNGVEYKLYVSFPEGYHTDSTQRYPVLYLLDADYSFAIAKNIIDHLAKRNHIREIIIVGIAYAGPDQY